MLQTIRGRYHGQGKRYVVYASIQESYFSPELIDVLCVVDEDRGTEHWVMGVLYGENVEIACVLNQVKYPWEDGKLLLLWGEQHYEILEQLTSKIADLIEGLNGNDL